MTRPLTVSAPGSLMLLGEHAVLHGHPCLVAAINRRVRVSLSPRNDGMVTIASALGNYESDRDALVPDQRFRFIIACLQSYAETLPGGLDLLIEAGMPPTIGFGTSAAVTVACCGALHAAGHGDLPHDAILHAARLVVREVQGRGSGADVAASVYGGVIYYRQTDARGRVVSRLVQAISALYSGYKTPTPEVIARVENEWRSRPEALEALYKKMAATVDAGCHAIEHPVEFGAALNEGHLLLQQLGVSTPKLEKCAARLRAMDGITGAKISGSGLGDCVIGWGRNKAFSDPNVFDVQVSAEGVTIE